MTATSTPLQDLQAPQSSDQTAVERRALIKRGRANHRVRPSIVDPATAEPFSLDQELKRFASWTSDPIWVPPKDVSDDLTSTMLAGNGPFADRQTRWQSVVDTHRSQFTQVRQIELVKASIRLPKGRLYVSVTEREHFDRITDDVPASVQTRLDEFLDGPGSKPGVKVSYLKPLCVEVGEDLHFTSRKDIDAAIQTIQNDVFAKYGRRWFAFYAKRMAIGSIHHALFLPRLVTQLAIKRRNKAIDAYQAKLEFERRRTALRAANLHGNCRTSGCTYDEMLALTNPLDRRDVANQYGIEQELSEAKRKQLVMMAAGHLPWFTALSLGVAYLASVVATITTTGAPAVFVCDPVFVAEFPDKPGQLWNIGHFDKVSGVRHIEF